MKLWFKTKRIVEKTFLVLSSHVTVAFISLFSAFNSVIEMLRYFLINITFINLYPRDIITWFIYFSFAVQHTSCVLRTKKICVCKAFITIIKDKNANKRDLVYSSQEKNRKKKTSNSLNNTVTKSGRCNTVFCFGL